MFTLRGIAISLALFWLTYCVLSLLVAAGWQWLRRASNLSSASSARLLFAARIFPLIASAVVVLALAVPSFLLLEPRGTQEEIGTVPLILGATCLVFFIVGSVRLIRAQARTSLVIERWLRGASAVDVGASAPTFEAGGDVPPLALAGVCRPRLVLSKSTVAVLSPDELRSAVRHEIAHMRFHDNLKKLAIQFAWFPFMQKLEHSWQHAAEVAADDAAVSNASEALDLAAALIKVSRMVPAEPLPAISMGLVQDGSVSERISRLLNWQQQPSRTADLRALAAPAAFALFFAVMFSYGPLIAETHRLTEWLVR